METKSNTNEIYFRPLELDDLDLLYIWFQDKEVTDFSLNKFQYPNSRIQVKDWIEEASSLDKKSVTFGIVFKESKKLIGFAGITSINSINRSGEYFILIGNKECWNKGIGTSVTKEIVHYGFLTLNLNRIMLTVSDINLAAVKAYEKSGFVREGVLRKASYRNGEYHDKILMSVLKEEWSNKG